MKIFKYLNCFLPIILSFYACQSKGEQESETEKEEVISYLVSRTLDNLLIEYEADSGLVIIMDSKQNKIISRIFAHRSNSGINHSAYHPICFPAMIRGMVYLAALQVDHIEDEMVYNTGPGIYLSHLPLGKKEKELIKDHNWRRGGYNSISMQRGFEVHSNIATTMVIEHALSLNSEMFLNALKQQGINIEKNDISLNNLLSIKITPEEQTMWMNLVATIGRSDSLYIDLQSNKKFMFAINRLRKVLRQEVKQGLSRKADSYITDVCGTGFTYKSADYDVPDKSIYWCAFCGYFPIYDPVCTIYVELSKSGLPLSAGGMCGRIFKTIVEDLCTANIESLKKMQEINDKQ